MNRLKTILLAGTIIPALVLAPFAASAQAPEKHQPGKPEAAGHQSMKPAGAMKAEPHAAAKEPGMKPEPHNAMKSEGGAVPKPAGAMKAEPHGAVKADTGTKMDPRAKAAPKAEAATDASPAATKADKKSHGADRMPGKAPAAADRMAPSNAAEKPPTNAAEKAPVPGERPNAHDRAERPNAPGMQARPNAPVPGARPGAPGTGAPANNAARPNGGPTNAMQNGAHPNQPGTTNTNTTNSTTTNTTINNTRTEQRYDNRNGGDRNGISPGGAAAIGAAAGFAGGFLAATGAQRLDDIRRDRRETVEDGRTYIREPGRTIVEDNGRSFIVHDENDRFRQLGYDVKRERRGNDFVDVVDRPGGEQILTYTDDSGRMLRRVRRYRDGREFVLIDNGVDGRVRSYQDDVVDLPPPPMRIPRDRYVVDYQGADEGLLYETLTAPPLQAPPKRYTLDQIRYSPTVRSYVRSIDINTINFDSGSWTVPAEATGKLQALAGAIKKAVAKNPNTVFLVEGYTDATGNPNDNLSLSDRRAQSVATIMTKSFGVPPENLTTQGYGQQNPKENTTGPSAANRRVVVQNITPLLAAGGQPPQ